MLLFISNIIIRGMHYFLMREIESVDNIVKLVEDHVLSGAYESTLTWLEPKSAKSWSASNLQGNSVFYYVKAQRFGSDILEEGKLSLQKVVEGIQKGCFTVRNTLTIDRWSNNILPNVYRTLSAFEEDISISFKEGSRHERLYKIPDYEEPLKLAHQYHEDMPAWALLRHADGTLHVAVTQRIDGQHWIGALDAEEYLRTGEIKMHGTLRNPYPSSRYAIREFTWEDCENEEWVEETREALRPQDNPQFTIRYREPYLAQTGNQPHPDSGLFAHFSLLPPRPTPDPTGIKLCDANAWAKPLYIGEDFGTYHRCLKQNHPPKSAFLIQGTFRETHKKPSE